MKVLQQHEAEKALTDGKTVSFVENLQIGEGFLQEQVELISKSSFNKVLVVAPVWLRSTVKKAWEKTGKSVTISISDHNDNDVLIITTNSFIQNSQTLYEQKWDLIIMDWVNSDLDNNTLLMNKLLTMGVKTVVNVHFSWKAHSFFKSE